MPRRTAQATAVAVAPCKKSPGDVSERLKTEREMARIRSMMEYSPTAVLLADNPPQSMDLGEGLPGEAKPTASR